MPTLIAGTLVLAMPDVSGLTPYACVTPVFAHLLPEVVAFTAVLLIFIQRRRSLGWPSETNRPKILFWTKGALWVGAAITLWCTAVSALVYATGFTPVPTGVGLFQQVVQATCLLSLLSYLPPALIDRESSAADAEVANTIIPEKFANKQTKTPIKIAGYLAMVCTIASACLWKTTCILQSWADPTTLREGYSLIVTTLLLALLELVDITRVGNRGVIRVCLVCLAILLTTGIVGSAITLVRSADPEYMLDFQVLRTMEAACVVLQTLALIFDVRFGVHISSADINASDSSKPSAKVAGMGAHRSDFCIQDSAPWDWQVFYLGFCEKGKQRPCKTRRCGRPQVRLLHKRLQKWQAWAPTGPTFADRLLNFQDSPLKLGTGRPNKSWKAV